MIRLICNDKVLLASMRKLLEARTEIQLSSHWTSLLAEPEGGSCTVVVLCEQDRKNYESIVREIVPESAESVEAAKSAATARVWVDVGGWLARRMPQWLFGRITHPVVTGESVALLLWDAIQQECARAALCDADCRLQEMQQCSEALKGLFRVVLHSEQAVTSMEQAVERTGYHKSTLYKDWQGRIGERPAPKDFIDKVALLRVRRHKTLAQSWPAAAEECGTNTRHLREISRRWMPRWPGDRDGAAWIQFADKFRTEFALSVAPRAANR